MDFRKLSRQNQIKVIDNVIDQHGKDFLAFLIAEGDYYIYGWFSFNLSNEGEDYWFEIHNSMDKSEGVNVPSEYIGVTSSTLYDEYGRPYEQTVHGKIYLSRNTNYEYSIKN